MKKLILFLGLTACPLIGQVPVYQNVIFVSSAPSGACTNGQPLQAVISTGSLYSCQAGTWGAVGGGGGGGVSGSGTTGYLPIWTGSTALGNSPADYGVTKAGDLTLRGPVYVPLSSSAATPSYALTTWQTLTPSGAWVDSPGWGSPALLNWMSFNGDAATGTMSPVAGYSYLDLVGSTAALTDAYSWYNEADVTGTQPVGIVYAEEDFAANYGTATVGTLYGVDAETENDAGTITGQQVAVTAAIRQFLGSTTPTGGGFLFTPRVDGAGSSFTTVHGVEVASANLTNGGTIGTDIGLYLDALAESGVTTAYSIYQAGATDKNYFHGTVQMDNLPTTAQTSVVGIDSSGNLYKNTTSGGGGGAWTNITGSGQITASGCTQSASTGGYCSISGSSTSSITLSVIPGTYNALHITAWGEASSGPIGMNMTLNGDTSNHYSVNGTSQSGGASAVPLATGGEASCQVGGMGAANASASQVDLPFYADTTFSKTATWLSYLNTDTNTLTNNYFYAAGCAWNQTSAVTSVTLSIASGHYVAGTKFIIYGVN